MTVARFWREQKNRYNLLGTQCTNCGRTYFPPREICLDCHRKSIGKMDNLKLSGNGTVVSYSIVHEASDNFKLLVPFAIALIELDEGTCITGQIVNANCEGTENAKCDSDSENTRCSRKKDIKIGSRVKSVFRKISEDGKSGIIHYGYKFKIID